MLYALELTMRHINLLAASAFMMVSSSTALAGAYDFFPMDVGNLWVYETPTGHHVVQVNDGTSLGGGWYANDADGLLSGPTWIYDNTSTDAMLGYDGGWSALFDFGAAVGDTWAFQASDCDAYTVEVEESTDVETPAGDYPSITRFILSHTPDPDASCSTAPVASIGFAEGLGPVWITDGSRSTGRLIYARVAGVVEAMAPGASGGTDALEMSLVITDDRPAAAGNLGVMVALTNTSSSPQTLVMPEGEPFVIDIFERMGTTPISTWSGAEGGSMTLDPGESRIMFGHIDIESDWEGAYRVEGSVASSADLPTLSVDIRIH